MENWNPKPRSATVHRFLPFCGDIRRGEYEEGGAGGRAAGGFDFEAVVFEGGATFGRFSVSTGEDTVGFGGEACGGAFRRFEGGDLFAESG